MRVAVGQPTPPPVQTPVPKAPVVESKPVRGYYRRTGDSVLFQPCGDPQYYPVVGFWEATNALRERYRFSAYYAGRPMFAAIRGRFVEDTVRGVPAASASAPSTRVVKSFYVAKFDTLRARTDSDCRGARYSSAR